MKITGTRSLHRRTKSVPSQSCIEPVKPRSVREECIVSDQLTILLKHLIEDLEKVNELELSKYDLARGAVDWVHTLVEDVFADFKQALVGSDFFMPADDSNASYIELSIYSQLSPKRIEQIKKIGRLSQNEKNKLDSIGTFEALDIETLEKLRKKNQLTEGEKAEFENIKKLNAELDHFGAPSVYQIIDSVAGLLRMMLHPITAALNAMASIKTVSFPAPKGSPFDCDANLNPMGSLFDCYADYRERVDSINLSTMDKDSFAQHLTFLEVIKSLLPKYLSIMGGIVLSLGDSIVWKNQFMAEALEILGSTKHKSKKVQALSKHKVSSPPTPRKNHANRKRFATHSRAPSMSELAFLKQLSEPVDSGNELEEQIDTAHNNVNWFDTGGLVLADEASFLGEENINDGTESLFTNIYNLDASTSTALRGLEKEIERFNGYLGDLNKYDIGIESVLNWIDFVIKQFINKINEYNTTPNDKKPNQKALAYIKGQFAELEGMKKILEGQYQLKLQETLDYSGRIDQFERHRVNLSDNLHKTAESIRRAKQAKAGNEQLKKLQNAFDYFQEELGKYDHSIQSMNEKIADLDPQLHARREMFQKCSFLKEELKVLIEVTEKLGCIQVLAQGVAPRKKSIGLFKGECGEHSMSASRKKNAEDLQALELEKNKIIKRIQETNDDIDKNSMAIQSKKDELQQSGNASENVDQSIGLQNDILELTNGLNAANQRLYNLRKHVVDLDQQIANIKKILSKQRSSPLSIQDPPPDGPNICGI